MRERRRRPGRRRPPPLPWLSRRVLTALAVAGCGDRVTGTYGPDPLLVTVSPTTLGVGGRAELTVVRYSWAREAVLPLDPAAVRLGSSDPRVARVELRTVVGVAPGRAWISGTAGGQADSVLVTVREAP